MEKDKTFKNFEKLFDTIFQNIYQVLEKTIQKEKNETKKQYEERLVMLASVQTLFIFESQFKKYENNNIGKHGSKKNARVYKLK